MGHYNTEQKTALVDYMKSHSDSAFTIEELITCMHRDYPHRLIPGKSTVYRIMPQLVQDGMVKRFMKDNSRKFLYQMICGDNCDCHLHLKCSSCGKIYHMDDKESQDLLNGVFTRYGFLVDEGKTILFGQCVNCKKS